MTDEGRPDLETLSGTECYRLLATRQVGRLGVDSGRYPLIFPVNYALDGDVILLRTGPGTKLAASGYTNVTFEVDQVDEVTRSGWSVLVRGVAEDVTAAHRGVSATGARARTPDPWAPGERERWIRIVPHGISGRLIVPGPAQTGS